MPNLYIIAGCNVAGKTTASYTVFPELLGCKEFVNADEIARGLSPLQPDTVAIEAGKIMLNRVNELIRQQKDLAFETTLSSMRLKEIIEQARANNYSVSLIFIWLNNPELAIDRVKQRVAEGGHHIPEYVIRRRYAKGLENLNERYMEMVDYLMIADNSYRPLKIVAKGNSKGSMEVMEREIFNKLL